MTVFAQGFGLRAASLIYVQCSQIVERRRHVRVFGSLRPLVDREAALVQGFGLCVTPLHAVRVRQVAER